MAEKMKVVWLVNVLFPEACRLLGFPEPVIGGWLYSYKAALKQYYPEIQLVIISPHVGKNIEKIESNGDIYYAFPSLINRKSLEQWLFKINNEIQPDVVHIHGSEYIHSLSYVNVCGNSNTLLSIQGMVSICAYYYYGGINSEKLDRYSTFRDIIKKDTIKTGQKRFYESGKEEIDLIKRIRYIVGRTSWDYANCWALNPTIHYFRCEEALRNSFYNHHWNINKCNRHSIFLSQVFYPIKGLHKFLEALPIILKQYPDTQVYLAGDDLTLKPWHKRTTYWSYLKSIIDKLELHKHLHFLGQLSEAKMAEQYISANVFVCPSIIENSSNSVCEAQLLGTPIVASYVGGMMDLIEDEKTGLLYRFEETAMLARKICNIFENDELASRLSKNGKAMAIRRHDRKIIADSLHNIYIKIINKKLL